MEREYTWNELYFPSFYPVEEPSKPGMYYVGLSVTCYPDIRGGERDMNAYPEALVKFAGDPDEGLNTKFLLEWVGRDDKPLDSMSFDEAASIADDLNDRYHSAIMKAFNSWEWDRMPIDLSKLPLVWAR